MLAEGIREVVLDLQLPIVVVARQIETLAESPIGSDLDFWRARENRMALAGFPLDQRTNLVDLSSENGGQRKHAADALVDELLSVAKCIGSFRLPMAASETLGVITRTQTTDAEVIGGAELIIVVSQQREEVLELTVRAFQGM